MSQDQVEEEKHSKNDKKMWFSHLRPRALTPAAMHPEPRSTRPTCVVLIKYNFLLYFPYGLRKSLEFQSKLSRKYAYKYSSFHTWTFIQNLADQEEGGHLKHQRGVSHLLNFSSYVYFIFLSINEDLLVQSTLMQYPERVISYISLPPFRTLTFIEKK